MYMNLMNIKRAQYIFYRVLRNGRDFYIIYGLNLISEIITGKPFYRIGQCGKIENLWKLVRRVLFVKSITYLKSHRNSRICILCPRCCKWTISEYA